MGRRYKRGTTAGRLRRSGVRLSAGAWTVYANTATAGNGRLIVALGRTAGVATTRSRVRRIAREVLSGSGCYWAEADVLLLARSDVSCQPRRAIRADLAKLRARLAAALTPSDAHTD